MENKYIQKDRELQHLMKLLESQYGSEYAEKILAGYAAKRKVTLRVNTIKSSVNEVEDVLQKENIQFFPVSWYSEAFIIENADERSIQELDIYKEGKIYLQSLSSMLPPLILKPEAGADILDMTAAPGSKTTQIAALTNNKAHVTACEINAARASRLRYNIQKQGAACVYVLQSDARKLDNYFAFDQILLDAPCSGSGVLHTSNGQNEIFFRLELIDKSVKMQKALLDKAIELLKKGREMVYSTCSILSRENEDIIERAVTSGKAEIVPAPTDELKGLPLLPVKLKGTVCIAPNELYEGFFVAKLKKL